MSNRIFQWICGLIVMVIVINSGCSSGTQRDDDQKKKDVDKAYDAHIESMVNQISLMNSRSPSTFSVSFVIVGSMKNKKFKSIGTIDYDKKLNLMNASFLDYIFKSPVTTIFKNGYNINFYFPAENKLVMDDTRLIDLRNYLDLSLDFNLFYDLICGKIPIIENYKIKQGLSVKEGKGSFLILENAYYYQTISYSTLKPDKILFLKKDNNEKYEVYIKEYEQNKETHYFKNIRILVKNSDIELDFTFESIRLNIPVKVNTMDKFRLPAGVKIIKM